MVIFNKKEKNKKSGFSLIEMVVVVGSFSMIIVGIISTILLTFNSQTKVKTNNKVSENGRIVLSELRRNIFNSSSNTIVCDVGGSSVSFINQKDKETTILRCLGDKIASNSANLNSSEVVVYGCESFATCTVKVGSTEVASVEFNFGLKTGIGGVGSSQVFNTTVTTRN